MGKSYTKEDLEDAVNAVQHHRARVAAASRQYGVPETTIRDRVHGRTSAESKRGPKKMLTEEEERSLANYAKFMANLGVGLTVLLLCTFAHAILQERTPKRRLAPKKDWARSFMKRHNLSLKQASVISKARHINSTKETFDEYFRKLEQLYTDHQLHDKPQFIYNVDESYFGKKQAGHRRKVISPKGDGRQYQQQLFTAEHTTLLSCINAAGDYLPTMLIFTASLPSERYKSSLPNDMLLAYTKTGFITKSLFEQWFEKIFLPRCGSTPEQPVLLIMDNCSTHFSYQMVKLAIENNVHIMCEPTYTSHKVQPLDKIFDNLTTEFEKRCHLSKVVDLHSCVNKGNFAVKLNEAMRYAWSKGMVESGFSRTGIYPLDRSKVKAPSRLDISCSQSPPLPEPETESSDLQVESTPQSTPSISLPTPSHSLLPCPSVLVAMHPHSHPHQPHLVRMESALRVAHEKTFWWRGEK